MKDIIGTYRVLAKPNPFKDEVLETVVGARLSLREILGNEGNNFIISLNGEIVESDQWELVFPAEDDLVVITRIPGEGRDILRLVAAIAVIAIAFWAGPALAAALPGSSAFWTSATMFFGMVAIGILLPPKLPDTSLEESKRLNSLTGTRNRFAPFAPIPNIYGKHRMYPPIASLPVTEVIGEDQYLNMIFCVGLGDYTIDPASVKIGDTLATAYEDVDVRQTDQPTQPDIFELQQSLVLGQPATPGDTFTRTTAVNTDQISLDFVLPAGLIQVDPDDGDRHYIRLHFSVEYRATGTADPWVHITATDWNQATRGRREVLGIPADDNPVELTTSAGAIRVSSQNANWLMVEARTRDPFRVGVKWTTSSSGQWDVRVTRQASQLDTRSNRDETDETWEEFSSTFVWTALRSYDNSTLAVSLPAGIATFITLRVRATDQLNGVIDSLNVIAQRKLRTWDKVGQQFTTPAVTRDPAWAYLDILTGLGNARPIASGDEINKIDLDSLADWATANAAAGFFYDEVIDYNTSVFDALSRVCGVGRAALSNRDGKWTVILEQAGGSPVQLFTPRNSWNFTGSKRFVSFPHALKVRFNSEDSDYQEDEMIVYDDGFNSGNATEFEVMELPGVTDSDQAWKVGRYTIASIRLRPEIYTFYADLEHIVAQRGDHILMTHDIPLWGTGFGRITDINGNTVTIDSEMLLDIAKSYRMRVRLSDGTTVIEDLTVQGGTVVSHTFTPSIPAGIAVGDLAIVGELNAETQELVVVAIEPETDLTAKITCVDHNDAILTADTGPIPPFNPNITLPPDPKTLTPLPPFNVQANSTQLNFPTDGNSIIQQRIVVTWDINSQAVNRWSALSADLRWREWDVTLNGGTWNYIRSFNAFQAFINIDNVDIGNDYEIQMRTISPFGTPSPWTTSIIHTVGGGTRLPPTIDGLTTTDDFGGVIVTIDYTTMLFRNGSYVEIAHNTVNDRDNVNTKTSIFTIPSDLNSLTTVDYLIPFIDTNQRFFWARVVDVYGTSSNYVPLSPTAGISGTPLQSTSQFYYIKPTDGTAIKNSTGTLTVEARVVNGSSDTLLSTGTIQLYDPSNLLVTQANGYVAGSDGYTGILDADDILGDKVITLKDGPAGAPIDTITLVDITDGLDSIVGFIEPSNGLAWRLDGITRAWTPSTSTTDLDVTFNQAGVDVARQGYRITLDTATGLLTGATTTHPLGDLNISRITITPSGSGTGAMTVKFDYSFDGFASSVSETVAAIKPGSIAVVADPYIQLGASFWDLSCTGTSCTLPTYSTGTGTSGTDTIRFAGSATTQIARHEVRRGPDEFDVQATQGLTIGVSFRVKYAVAGTGSWNTSFVGTIVTSDVNDTNTRLYNSGVDSQVIFDQNSTLGEWVERTFTAELAQENLETPPRYVSIRISANGNNNGAEYDVDLLDAWVVGAVFKGDDPGFVPDASAAGAATFLKNDGTWADPTAGGGGLPITPGQGFHRTLRWDEATDTWVYNDSLLSTDSGRTHVIASASAILELYASGAGVDEKGTALKQTHTSGFNPAFIIQTINDGADGFGTNGPTLLRATRVGNTWDETELNTPLSLQEQTLTPGGATARGKIWVKDDVPNTLWFTDDAGNDVQLGVPGDVTASGTPSDSQLAVWTGANSIEGDANLSYDTILSELIVIGDGALRLDERATGPTGITAHGKLWVRNDTPNTLMFTDDAGTEFAIGGSTVSGVDSVTAGNGLTQNATTGDVTLNVGVGTGLSVAADSIGLNYSALAEKTGDLVGTDRIAACSSTGTEFVETISNIPLSIFNNDAGFITNGVAVSGSPSDGQIAVWTGGSAIEGDVNLQYDTVTNQLMVLGDGAVRIDERATGPSGITAHGLLWVRNDAPNTLMFTDDLGNEIEVAGTASGVTSVTAGNGLTQNQTTGAVTLNVGVGTGLSVAADSIGLNYSALPEKTGTVVGTDRIAIASGASEVCETISNIPLSIFNNDLPSGGNADTLDGLDSTAFARLGTTTPPDNYLYTGRAHTSSAMYVRQGSSGDIARFLQSATAGATSSTTQVTITNSGGITATGNITGDHVLPNATGTFDLGSSSLEWNQLWVQQIELNSTDTTIARKAAGVVSVENRAMIAHASSTYTSAEVTFSVSTPTTQGTDGDIWFVY